MEELRKEGNDLFIKKQYIEAIEKYTMGLNIKDENIDISKQNELFVPFWNNRAACYLPLQQYKQAYEDCTQVLNIEPKNEKARYRRSQALVGLNRYTEAFQDIRVLLQLNPTSKAGITLARKIKEIVQDDVHGFQKAFDKLRSGVLDEKCDIDTIIALQKLTEEALVFLEMKCASDLTTIPKQLETKGGLVLALEVLNRLFSLFNEIESYKENVKYKERYNCIVTLISRSLLLLSVMASANGTLAMQIYQFDSKLFQQLLTYLQSYVARTVAIGTQGEENNKEEEDVYRLGYKAVVKLCAFVLKAQMNSGSSRNVMVPAFNGVLDGLRSHALELQLCAVDSLILLLTTPGKVEEESKADKTNRLNCATLGQELGLFSLLQSTSSRMLQVFHINEIQNGLDNNQDSESEKARLLNRLALVFTQTLAPFEEKDSILKQIVRDYCIAPVLAASPGAVSIKVSTDEILPEILANVGTSCLFLSSLFLMNPKLALWGVQQTANDGTLFLTKLHALLVASRDWVSAKLWPVTQLQCLFVDCIASICSVENGVGTIPPPLRIDLLKLLHVEITGSSIALVNLKACALSIHVKIGVVEKTLDIETAEGKLLLGTIFEVLEKVKDETKNTVHLSLSSPKDRAVEALSYLITLTPVKDALAQRPTALASLFQDSIQNTSESTTVVIENRETKHHHLVHKSPLSQVEYGMAYILHHTLTSESHLKKKKMQDTEMTPEQYEELQKALKQKSALEDGDSPEQVKKRVESLVQASVLRFLVSLLKNGAKRSTNVLDMAVNSALDAAEVPAVRGKLVQSGVFQALIPFALTPTSTSNNKKPIKQSPLTAIAEAAGHAVAKILISTNPNLVPSNALFSSIKVLLDLCKNESHAQLLQFEALLALTNVASVSDDTKKRIVSEPHALSTLQYLQFSDHEMIRRAATEAICNLLPQEQVVEQVFKKEDKLKLWLAFASASGNDSDEEEEAQGQVDFETARAAAGALAMVTQFPEVSFSVMKANGLSIFKDILLNSTREEMLHRALYTLTNLFQMAILSVKQIELPDNEKDKIQHQQSNFLSETKDHKDELIKRLEEIIHKNLSPNIKEAGVECLQALKSALQ